MKLSIFAIVAASASAKNSVRNRRQNDDRNVDGGAKRYSQLIDQMTLYNNNFDERQYWTYGCHCLMLGDRPMSTMGKGAPLDALDSVCKAYKECQKCARQRFGDMCIGEFVRYGMAVSSGSPVCNDSADSCGRALCECDKKFAQEHVGAIDVYTDDYHRFYSSPEFDSDAMCIPNGGGVTDPQCCNNSANDGPYVLYNAVNKECCADGSTAAIGSC